MNTLISEAKARGPAMTAAVEHLRLMLENSLRFEDAIDRAQQLEDATGMRIRTLDHEVGRRQVPLRLKIQMETVEQLLDDGR
jgi:hypothetical protein